MTRNVAVFVFPCLVALSLGACRQSPSSHVAETPSSALPAVSPPLEKVENAYEEAARTKLAEQKPRNWDDLQNVYRLSANIISGSEPHGEKALERIAGMGVRTIVSVDGKVPDEATAAKYGMRYVHVPIHYSGISKDEMLRLAKTFREMEGPFFVHCFHGKHRGPAGAAFGRLILDGVSRREAIAEMRQWCGTAGKYEGLYGAVASGEIPTAAATGAYDWDFPAAHPLGGFRSAMVGVSRSWDYLKLLHGNRWAPLADHPDLDAVNESDKLRQLFARCAATDTAKRAQEDFRGWMADSVERSRNLGTALREFQAGNAASVERADRSFRGLGQNCKSCHAGYRNG